MRAQTRQQTASTSGGACLADLTLLAKSKTHTSFAKLRYAPAERLN
jgi:hypothetical protein